MRRAYRAVPAVGLLFLSLAAAPVGCGGPKPADPDQARATLAMALDAWRDGRTMDDVTNGSPPIVVADPSWKAGFKLARYEVASTTRSAGFDLKIPVQLWLTDTQGKAVQEKVKYTVSVQPSRTVIRSPL
jgi:hypothetical protein